MSRTLTASDRSALIRLASTLPKASSERRTILAGLDKKAWGENKRLGPKLVGYLNAGQGLLVKVSGQVIPVSPKNGEQFTSSEVDNFVGGKWTWVYYGDYRWFENRQSPTGSSNLWEGEPDAGMPANEKATLLRNGGRGQTVYGDVFIASPATLDFRTR